MIGRPSQVFDVLIPADLADFGAVEISSSSTLHAAAAVILLSEGNFAVRAKDGTVVVPRFNESGEGGLDLWWSEQRLVAGRSYLLSFFAWVKQEAEGIVEALASLRAVGDNAPDIFQTEIGMVASALADELKQGASNG